MLLLNHCLLRLAVLAGISNLVLCTRTSSINNPSVPFFKSESASSSANRNLALTDNQSPSYPDEITCPDETYTGFIELSYTYSVEILSGTDPFVVISNIEGEILLKLSETVLSCGGGGDGDGDGTGWDDSAYLFSKDQLGIVKVNSQPDDTPSQLSHCVSLNDDCIIVLGKVTVYTQDQANLASVLYATRYVINQVMRSNYLVPRVKNLMTAFYNGPEFTPPPVSNPKNKMTGAPPSNSNGVNGLSPMTKVVIATLCSAVVGIVAAFILFKKVFNSKQNCFAHCDGTGLDRRYIDNAHFQSPRESEELSISAGAYDNAHIMDDMEVVHYDIANGLSVINEGSEAMSTATARSYAMSTSRVNLSCDTSIAWSDARSAASEKTIPTSNKHRTPAFGEGDRDLHII